MTWNLIECLKGLNVVRTRSRGRRRARRPLFEQVEDRCLLAVVYWSAGTDGDWNTAANWTVQGPDPAIHRVPTATDDALIDPSTAVTVTISSGTDAVKSLSCHDTLDVTGGTLSVVADSSINTLNLSTGATVAVTGNAGMTIGDGSTIAGTVSVSSLATFDFGGQGSGIDINPGVSLTSSGTFETDDNFGTPRINAAITLPQTFEINGGDDPPTVILNADVTTGANLDLIAGTIEGPDTLTVPAGDTFSWQGSAIAGTLDVRSGANLTISNTSPASLSGILNNAGTANLTENSAGINISTSGTFNNQVDATFAVATDSEHRGGRSVWYVQQLWHLHEEQSVALRRYLHRHQHHL